MKIRKIIYRSVQVILILTLFFIGIGSTLSDRGQTYSGLNMENRPLAHALRNEYSGFAEASVLDHDIEHFRQRWGIKGLSVAIAQEGRLVYAKGFGYANEEKQEEVEPWHLFRIASISKLVTGVAVMKLVEEGHISLDDKVFGPSGILNDPAYLDYSDKRIEDITVRQLLTHTAGWSRRYGDPMFMQHKIARVMNEELPIDNEIIIRYALSGKLHFTPGSRYSYSNLGYAILGKVIEKRSGMAYEDYVALNVLHPLGIYDMEIGGSFYEERATHEVRYYEPSYSPEVYAFDGSEMYVPKAYGGNDLESLAAAGGWIASSVELIRLVTAIDGFEEIPDILAEETLEAMTTKENTKGHLIGWKGSDGNGTWWRTGTLSGSSALVVRQNNGIAWTIMINTTTSKRSRIHRESSRMMFHAIAKVRNWPGYDLFDYRDLQAIEDQFMAQK